MPKYLIQNKLNNDEYQQQNDDNKHHNEQKEDNSEVGKDLVTYPAFPGDVCSEASDSSLYEVEFFAVSKAMLIDINFTNHAEEEIMSDLLIAYNMCSLW